MAQFNGSLFNDSLFDGNYVLGSGGAAGGAHASCGGTVVKACAVRVIAVAALTLRGGRLTACAAANLGAALTTCLPARIRRYSGTSVGVVVAICDGLRVRISGAAAVGVGQAASVGRRIRTSHIRPCGVAVLGWNVEKLAFPPLAHGLRVRRWSKPARVLDLRAPPSP